MTENPWPNGVPTIMPAEDRAEIQELYARYAWGIDLADEDMAIATFAAGRRVRPLVAGQGAGPRGDPREPRSRCGTTGSTGGTAAST